MTDERDDYDSGLLLTLDEIGRLVSSSGENSETLDNIVRLLQARFGTDVCSVYLTEPTGTGLVLSATIGLSPAAVGRVRLENHEGLVAEQRAPLVLGDATTHPRFKYVPESGEDPYHSFLGVPILDRGLLHGVLVIQTRDSREFLESDIRMLNTAATQLAPLVSDVRLEEMHQSESEVVQRAKAQLLQTLAGGIAHELNNKLMPVSGFAELVLDEARRLGNTRLEDYSRTIRDSIVEASRISQQILQLSKPQVTRPGPALLGSIVQQALTLLRLRLKETGILVNAQIPDEPITVKMDAAQIKQVIVNLVWNAVDAMQDHREPVLTLAISRSGSTARLICSDTSTGIHPDALSRVFDPFFTTKNAQKGSGLGLNVSPSIVKQHGGDIWVTSQLGAGSTFRVTLPIYEGEHGSEAESPLAAAGAMQAVPTARSLVIDDEAAISAVVAAAPETRLGHSVEQVRDGIEAMAALEREPFDLIVCDVRIPHMNAESFLRWIETNQPRALRRMLSMPGDSTDSPIKTRIRATRRPLLQKPFPVDALISAARHLLRDRGEPPTPRGNTDVSDSLAADSP